MVEPEFTLFGPVREKPEGRNPTAECLERCRNLLIILHMQIL